MRPGDQEVEAHMFRRQGWSIRAIGSGGSRGGKLKPEDERGRAAVRLGNGGVHDHRCNGLRGRRRDGLIARPSAEMRGG